LNILDGIAPFYLGDADVAGIAPYLLSVACFVKPTAPMNVSGRLSTFNPATNSYTRGAASTLPSALTPKTFTPSDVGGFGYITASYNKATKISLSERVDILSLGGRRRLTAGQSFTYYACATDKFGNYIQPNRALWSLTINQGSASSWSLVPASDAKSAVLTYLNNSASYCTINISQSPLGSASGGGGLNF
jgi:hypothetical protein